jgi:hypothetical protein
MKKVLKKYFIPHEGNDHQPYILRSKAVKIITAVIIFCELLFLMQIYHIFPRSNFMALIFPNVLVDETNENRSASNLVALKDNPILDEAARLKANDMAAKGYFAHTSPEGLTPWYWFDKVGYRFSYAGENLAVNFVDSQDVLNAWMNSSGHRANILNSYFTEIGIGMASGQYQGQEATFVVQLFGRPVPAISASPQPQKSEIKPVAVTATPSPLAAKDNFVAVKGAEVAIPGPASSEVAKTAPRAAALEKILSHPKITANFIYIAFGLLMIVALALTIFIKIKIQHPKLIGNGVLLLLLIAAMLLVNQFVTIYPAKII